MISKGNHVKFAQHKKVDEGGKGAVCWLRKKEKKQREPEEKKELAQTLKTFYVEARKKGFVQCIMKQLLDSGFVIFRIIKVSVRVISLSLSLDLDYSGYHKNLIQIWDNFEISRVVFMPNITYNSCYYLFMLLPAKGL